jgi:hypothetical protein
LADAPDLGLRFCRFHGIAFHFKAEQLYEGEMGVSGNFLGCPNDEQKDRDSSTQTCQTPPSLRVEESGDNGPSIGASQLRIGGLVPERGALKGRGIAYLDEARFQFVAIFPSARLRITVRRKTIASVVWGYHVIKRA